MTIRVICGYTRRVPPDLKGVVIRDLVTVEDMARVGAVERAVWGLDDAEIMPTMALLASVAAGAVLVGAFDGDALVGLAYGFPGFDRGRLMHHSHMLAVLPDYRSRDLGFALKLAQRDRVLAQGVDAMTWTFDPLRARNAHFNFSRLGVFVDSYRVNFYGESTSSFLHRFGTDRFWATWPLRDTPAPRRFAPTDEPALVRVGPGEEPELVDLAGLSDDVLRAEIPADIAAIEASDEALAVRWREATRAAFVAAIGAGYVVDAFARPERDRAVGVYRLARGGGR